MAIGARAQSAKTYLEKFMAEFPDADSEAMIKHSLKALSGCVQTDKQLEASNTCVVVIGPDQKLTMIEDAALQPYLDAIELEGDMPANDGDAGGDVDAMAT
jgi:20S proteasome subunit alpha 6